MRELGSERERREMRELGSERERGEREIVIEQVSH